MKRNILSLIGRILGLHNKSSAKQQDPHYQDRVKIYDPQFPIKHLEITPQGPEAEFRYLANHHHTIGYKTVREISEAIDKTLLANHTQPQFQILDYQPPQNFYGINLHRGYYHMGIDPALMSQSHGRITRNDTANVQILSQGQTPLFTYEQLPNPGVLEAYMQFWPMHAIDDSLPPMSIHCYKGQYNPNDLQRSDTRRHRSVPKDVASKAHNYTERIRKEKINKTAQQLLEKARREGFSVTKLLGIRTEDHNTDPIELKKAMGKRVRTAFELMDEADLKPKDEPLRNTQENRDTLKGVIESCITETSRKEYTTHKALMSQSYGSIGGQCGQFTQVPDWTKESYRITEKAFIGQEDVRDVKSIDDDPFNVCLNSIPEAKRTILEQFVLNSAIIIGNQKDDDVYDAYESIVNYFDQISLGERRELATQLRDHVELTLSDMLQERGHEAESLSVYSVFIGKNESLSTSFVCQVAWPSVIKSALAERWNTFEVRLADWTFEDLLQATLSDENLTDEC